MYFTPQDRGNPLYHYSVNKVIDRKQYKTDFRKSAFMADHPGEAGNPVVTMFRSLSSFRLKLKESQADGPYTTKIPVTPDEAHQTQQVEQLEFDKAVQSLLKGTELIKMSAAKKPYPRVFFLDPDYQTLFYYEPHVYKYSACQSRPRTIDMHSVREVRAGYKTDVFNACRKYIKFAQKHPEERCFSLILAGGVTVNLIAPTTEVCKSWVNVVQHILGKHQHETREARLEKWLRRQFKLADSSSDGYLNFEECMKLLSHLNLNFTREKAYKFFMRAGASDKGTSETTALDVNGFYKFYTNLSERSELREIFEKHGSGRDIEVWSTDDLQHFLQFVQMENNQTVESCEFILKTFEPLEENKDLLQLSLAGFRNYLLNQRQYLFNPNNRQVYQDMTYPLKDYFIASSHNTYLLANQLTGTSSVEAYVSCFLKGCRCVELDCWDGPDHEPVITHGHTLTSEILFRDVIAVVRDYGFRVSEYPVILSIENHCSLVQQNVMAAHLRDILKDMLYFDAPKESDKSLPSPDQLKRRVIVKAKKPNAKPVVAKMDSVVSSATSDGDEDLTKIGIDGADIDNGGKSGKHKQLQATISDVLSNGTYLKAVKFKSFAHAKELGKLNEMSSLSESRCNDLIGEMRLEFLSHCRRQLVRVYPDGTRADSSNYNPIPMFEVGCQIVALNYQDKNPETQVYKAMFTDNGGCGYLLKPEYMRNEEFNLKVRDELQKPILFKIKIISAQQLPKPDGLDGQDIADPYVTIQIFGCKRDCKREKTAFIRNNGFNPIWNQEFEFLVYDVELAVLRLEIMDYDKKSTDEDLAHYTIPVSCIQQGYRHVELFDRHDNSLEPATLFIYVVKEEYVAPTT